MALIKTVLPSVVKVYSQIEQTLSNLRPEHFILFETATDFLCQLAVACLS